MKQQFVLTHIIQADIPALLRYLSYKHTFCQNLLSTKNCLSLYCRNSMTYLHKFIMDVSSFSGSFKVVFRSVTTNCCFMSDICLTLNSLMVIRLLLLLMWTNDFIYSL